MSVWAFDRKLELGVGGEHGPDVLERWCRFRLDLVAAGGKQNSLGGHPPLGREFVIDRFPAFRDPNPSDVERVIVAPGIEVDAQAGRPGKLGVWDIGEPFFVEIDP